MSDSPLVRYEVVDGIAVLTLDDPPANAYTHAMMRQLDEAILKARKEWNPPWQRRAPPLKPSNHKREPYIDYEIPPDQIWTDED